MSLATRVEYAGMVEGVMKTYRVFYNPDCQMYGVEKFNKAGRFWQQVLPPQGKGGRGGKSAYTYYKAIAERWMKELEG